MTGSTLVFETGSTTVNLQCVVSSAVSTPSLCWLQTYDTMPDIYTGAGDLNSCPHA